MYVHVHRTFLILPYNEDHKDSLVCWNDKVRIAIQHVYGIYPLDELKLE